MQVHLESNAPTLLGRLAWWVQFAPSLPPSFPALEQTDCCSLPVWMVLQPRCERGRAEEANIIAAPFDPDPDPDDKRRE